MKNVLLCSLALLATMTTAAFGDDFEKLEQQQTKRAAANPFTNKKAVCSSKTEKGVEMKETWSFFGLAPDGGKYVKTFAGIVANGKYTYSGDMLTVEQAEMVIGTKRSPSDKKFELKVKMTDSGFKYIFSGPKGEMLYSCTWAGSASNRY